MGAGYGKQRAKGGKRGDSGIWQSKAYGKFPQAIETREEAGLVDELATVTGADGVEQPATKPRKETEKDGELSKLDSSTGLERVETCPIWTRRLIQWEDTSH